MIVIITLKRVKVVCTLKWTDKFFRFGEERSIVCYCTPEEKMNFEGFTQNGCYSNQPQPVEALFYTNDAKSSCSFTKQVFISKQAYLVSF